MSYQQLSPQEAIEALKASTEATVGPEMIAPILRMSPGVLRQHVRNGEYKMSEFDICGSRIRFARKDFLQKIGEVPPDEEERTDSDRLDELIELLTVQNMMLNEICTHIKKIASCCNS